jgi:processing peptidase subunit alpha
MHSRLYTRVLNQHPWMHNCTALNSIYNNTGLVGVFASAESSQAGEMVDVLCKEMLVGSGSGWEADCASVVPCRKLCICPSA